MPARRGEEALRCLWSQRSRFAGRRARRSLDELKRVILKLIFAAQESEECLDDDRLAMNRRRREFLPATGLDEPPQIVGDDVLARLVGPAQEGANFASV